VGCAMKDVMLWSYGGRRAEKSKGIGIGIARSICAAVELSAAMGRGIALHRLNLVIGSYWPSFYS
ncbi:hypothetical protein JI435_302500, partial [Parastagonospora nodorum SN15]